MAADHLNKIREIWASFDAAPEMLDAPAVAALTGLKIGTLASDRAGARRLGIPFIRLGRSIRYPKRQVGEWLLRHAVGIGGEDE